MSQQNLQDNLNKKSFPMKTRPPPLIVLIGCAAGSKQLIGQWGQIFKFFSRFLKKEIPVSMSRWIQPKNCIVSLLTNNCMWMVSKQPISLKEFFDSKFSWFSLTAMDYLLHWNTLHYKLRLMRPPKATTGQVQSQIHILLLSLRQHCCLTLQCFIWTGSNHFQKMTFFVI